MTIQYLPYKQIDKQKWDACMDKAGNSLIYGYSFYLDNMCRSWDAIILDDYKAVMPMPFNQKYGIAYLYQPPFCASLGIFGNKLTAELSVLFLNAIPKKFKYWDIYLNTCNQFKLEGYSVYQRKNYTLLLKDEYKIIYDNYSENIKRNIKKCSRLKGDIKRNISIDQVIKLSKKQATTFSKLTPQDYNQLKKIYNFLKDQQKAFTYGVYVENECIASAVFFIWKKRAYYILVGNHPNNKTMGASSALVDAFIADNAGSDLLLDFEGSDIPGIARFYSGFGADEETYPGLRYNNLPGIIRWMKK